MGIAQHFFSFFAVLLTSVGASAQSVTMRDGSTVPFNDVPAVKRFQADIWSEMMSRGNLGSIVFITTPAMCPSVWAVASDSQPVSEAVEICTSKTRSRLVGYGSALRDRCRCAPAIAGTLGSLKAVSSLAEDSNNWSNSTVVVREKDRRDRLRAIFGERGREFQLLNKDTQPVCTGEILADGERARLTCFAGRVSGKGTFRRFPSEDEARGRYGIGAFELENGVRVDFVQNIRVELMYMRHHPEFPR